MKHLNLFNNFRINEGHFDSSITKQEAESILTQIHQYQDALADTDTDWDDVSDRIQRENWDNELIKKCKERLYIYDRINQEFVINTLFNDSNVSSDDIIRMGDEIMNKFGTEPQMVIQAFEDCFSVFTANGIYTSDDEDETIEEKVKAQRYKGHRIPGKYLTKNPGKMKKEIDRFRGKREYKKDWDADYSSGKGGVGKRVKTKRSAASKAYQRMYGESKANEGLGTFLGIGAAILILRFIIKTYRSIRKYRKLMGAVMQAASFFSHAKLKRYKQEGGNLTLVEKDVDALQVVEYSDKYWIKFIPENSPLKSLRVFKIEEGAKVSKITIESIQGMEELPLPLPYYNELMEIIKRKL